MITKDNLMKSAGDHAWQEEYKKKMGETAYFNYKNKLFEFIDKMPEDSEIIIEHYVKPETEDLFAKWVCGFVYLDFFKLSFNVDYTKLRKYPKKF